MEIYNRRIIVVLSVLYDLSVVLADADDNCDDDKNGESNKISVGAIIAVCVVGVIIAMVTVLLCFHECCSKPKKKVKPQTISVTELDSHRVPPSQVIPTAPPAASIRFPVDPPPYQRFDNETPHRIGRRGLIHDNQSRLLFSRYLSPISSSGFQRHPPPDIAELRFNNRGPQTGTEPPPYSE